jgi:hypothetical protein
MCSNARREGIRYRVGGKVNVEAPAYEGKPAVSGKSEWSGCAKIEKHNYWKQEGNARPVSMLMDSFFEGGAEFEVPTGKISALGLRRNVKVNGKIVGKAQSVKMLTREARTQTEKSLHPRWPVVLVNGEMYMFTDKDIIVGQQSLGV